jgi:hypothetical protein
VREMQQNTRTLAIDTVFVKYPGSSGHVIGVSASIQMGRAIGEICALAPADLTATRGSPGAFASRQATRSPRAKMLRRVPPGLVRAGLFP